LLKAIATKLVEHRENIKNKNPEETGEGGDKKKRRNKKK